jgi:NADH dehydrogenase
VPSSTLLELVLQPSELFERDLGPAFRRFDRCVMIGGHQSADIVESFSDDVENRTVHRERHILDEPRGLEARLPPHDAAVGRKFTGDNLQQGRFSAAIPPENRDPLARLDLQCDAVQKRQMTERDGHALEGHEGHGEFSICTLQFAMCFAGLESLAIGGPMNLVAGGTGILGGEVCRLLSTGASPMRALVRATSNPERVARLKALGADTIEGDLKDRASLDLACRGVTAVISTVSSTLSRQANDSIDTVDRQGQLNLIDAAAAAGVSRFVLVSFPSMPREFPLQSAKREAEARLVRSGMSYTILRPTFFMDVWLSPALGFDPWHGSATIYGEGTNAISWISVQDVARFAVAALDTPAWNNATVLLGGPDALSPLDVVALAERTLGTRVNVQHMPAAMLEQQFENAEDPLQKSFAALMLSYRDGDVIDMSATLRELPSVQMKTVGDHLRSVAATV